MPKSTDARTPTFEPASTIFDEGLRQAVLEADTLAAHAVGVKLAAFHAGYLATLLQLGYSHEMALTLLTLIIQTAADK